MIEVEFRRPQTPEEYEKRRILDLIEQIRKSPLVASVNVIFDDELLQMEKAFIGGEE